MIQASGYVCSVRDVRFSSFDADSWSVFSEVCEMVLGNPKTQNPEPKTQKTLNPKPPNPKPPNPYVLTPMAT